MRTVNAVLRVRLEVEEDVSGRARLPLVVERRELVHRPCLEDVVSRKARERELVLKRVMMKRIGNRMDDFYFLSCCTGVSGIYLLMGDTIVAYHPWAFMCIGIFGMEWHLLALEKVIFLRRHVAVISIEHI
jgi:hypothetical protein